MVDEEHAGILEFCSSGSFIILGCHGHSDPAVSTVHLAPENLANVVNRFIRIALSSGDISPFLHTLLTRGKFLPFIIGSTINQRLFFHCKWRANLSFAFLVHRLLDYLSDPILVVFHIHPVVRVSDHMGLFGVGIWEVLIQETSIHFNLKDIVGITQE